uniref:C3H1-type domain-containing protein n=1 Tax=Anopheles farauti TaxID=69004 RepID=A0A182Q1D6_9DIPT
MFSLVADYSGDSEDSSTYDSTDEGTGVKQDPIQKPHQTNLSIKKQSSGLNDAGQSTLPLPSASAMLQSGTGSRPIAGSVFSNPFREAEEAKLASLEKHVKMVDPEANGAEQKRKVCWSYKKGRCRFGSKCNFAHGSDLILRKDTIAEAGDGGDGENEQESSTAANVAKKANPPDRKKRPGLSRELVPPKKVLKMYHKEKYGMLK